jgi:hypothetical protein
VCWLVQDPASRCSTGNGASFAIDNLDSDPCAALARSCQSSLCRIDPKFGSTISGQKCSLWWRVLEIMRLEAAPMTLRIPGPGGEWVM